MHQRLKSKHDDRKKECANKRILFFCHIEQLLLLFSWKNLLLFFDVVADYSSAGDNVGDDAGNNQSYRTEAYEVVVVPCQCHAQRDEYCTDNNEN